MKLLLDTHILLWALDQPDRLPAQMAPMLADPNNDVRFSIVSLWEIAVKSAVTRRGFVGDARSIRRYALETGFVELPLNAEHVFAVATLPPLHKDPFDRMLIAQARAEAMRLLTVDTEILGYQSVEHAG